MKTVLFSLLFLDGEYFISNCTKCLSDTKASTFHVLFPCIRHACRAFFRHPRPLWVHHLFEAPAIWRTRIHRVRNQFASVNAEVVSGGSTPCTDTRKECRIFMESEWKNRRYDEFFVTVSSDIAWSSESSGTDPTKSSVLFLLRAQRIYNSLIFSNLYHTHILVRLKFILTNNIFLLCYYRDDKKCAYN